MSIFHSFLDTLLRSFPYPIYFWWRGKNPQIFEYSVPGKNTLISKISILNNTDALTFYFNERHFKDENGYEISALTSSYWLSGCPVLKDGPAIQEKRWNWPLHYDAHQSAAERAIPHAHIPLEKVMNPDILNCMLDYIRVIQTEPNKDLRKYPAHLFDTETPKVGYNEYVCRTFFNAPRHLRLPPEHSLRKVCYGLIDGTGPDVETPPDRVNIETPYLTDDMKPKILKAYKNFLKQQALPVVSTPNFFDDFFAAAFDMAKIMGVSFSLQLTLKLTEQLNESQQYLSKENFKMCQQGIVSLLYLTSGCYLAGGIQLLSLSSTYLNHSDSWSSYLTQLLANAALFSVGASSEGLWRMAYCLPSVLFAEQLSQKVVRHTL